MYRHTCKVCGKQFETDDARQWVCLNTHFNTCLTCGKKFPVAKDGKASNYCSQKCNNNKPEWVRKQMYGTRICEICGKEFVPKQKTQTICSTVHYLPCPICGKTVEVKGHKKSKCCSNKCTQELKRRTCMEKYGVPVSSQAQVVKDKAENTFMERYGTKTASQNEDIKKKVKQQWLEKYGTDSPMRLESVKQKHKNASLKHYGVDHPWKSKEVLEKRKQTFIDKYGTPVPSKNEEVKAKMRKTMIERYGVDNAAKSPEIRNKIYLTNVKKYGGWYVDTEENRRNRSRPISKRNTAFADNLTSNNIANSLEYCFSDAKQRKFDIEVCNTGVLVELDSTAVHNSYKNVHVNEPYTGEITDIQFNKSKLAWNHQKYCVHVFDWDDTDSIVKYLAPRKYSIPASFLSKITTDRMQCIKFFNDNNVQLINNIEEYNSFVLLGVNDVPVYCIAYMQAASDKVRCSVCVANDYRVIDASAAVVKHCTLGGYISVVLDASKYIPIYGFDVSFEDLSSCVPVRVWSKASDMERSDLEETETSESYYNRIQQAWLPVHTCGFVSVNVE